MDARTPPTVSSAGIGMGLANAVSHLEKSKSKSKVIILLTDGVNNVGEISPLTAADMAKENGIRVYTIAIGASRWRTLYALKTYSSVKIMMRDSRGKYCGS